MKEITTIDNISVSHTGVVQIRTRTSQMDGDEEVSFSFHRRTIAPGADYSKEPAEIRDVCASAHTEQVVAAYRKLLATATI